MITEKSKEMDKCVIKREGKRRRKKNRKQVKESVFKSANKKESVYETERTRRIKNASKE